MKSKFFLLILVVNVYIYGTDTSNAPDQMELKNKASVGSRQQDSSQQYGKLSFKGNHGDNYNYNKKSLNSSTVGSTNQSSTQLFGNQTLKEKNFKPKSNKKLNKPTVGGRQSASDQMFGAL